jgi:hypothetical protein
MKKTIYVILLFAAAFVALFEQSKAHPNKYIMVGAIVLFMFGLMQLMSKVPSKNGDNHKTDDDDV